MVARHGVARGVAGAPHFTEELGDLARKNALILQAAQQVVLGLLRRLVQAALVATSCARSSASRCSLRSEVFGSSGKYCSASIPRRRSCSSCSCKWAKLLVSSSGLFIV